MQHHSGSKGQIPLAGRVWALPGAPVKLRWSFGEAGWRERPRCLRAVLCVVCRLFINQIYCYICSAHANEVTPSARDTALISFPASVGCSPGRGMEITRQCCIKAKIKESLSNWSVTAVCPASQLDAEGFFFFSSPPAPPNERQRWRSEPRASSLFPAAHLLERNFFWVSLTQTGCGGWRRGSVTLPQISASETNDAGAVRAAREAAVKWMAWSSYRRAEELAIRCLPAPVSIPALKLMRHQTVFVLAWRNDKRQ